MLDEADNEYINVEDRVMTIETKFNIGDEVYAKGNYGKGIIQCEVQDLRASAVFLGPLPTIEYTLRYCSKGKLKLLHRLEEEIFPTKEELLKSVGNGK